MNDYIKASTGKSLWAIVRRHWLWTLVLATFIGLTQQALKQRSFNRFIAEQEESVRQREGMRNKISRIVPPTLFIAELSAEAGNHDGSFEPHEHQELLELYRRCLISADVPEITSEMVKVVNAIIEELKKDGSLDHASFRRYAQTLNREVRSVFVEYRVDPAIKLPSDFAAQLMVEIKQESERLQKATRELESLAHKAADSGGRLSMMDKLFVELATADQNACILNRKLTARLYVAYYARIHLDESDVDAIVSCQRDVVRLAEKIRETVPMGSDEFALLNSYATNDKRRADVVTALRGGDYAKADSTLVAVIDNQR